VLEVDAMSLSIMPAGRDPDLREPDPFVSRCTLRFHLGSPAATVDLPVRMEHGSRDGHTAQHRDLATAIGAAIERVLEDYSADAEIEVEVKP
jgi:hypothetical protein